MKRTRHFCLAALSAAHRLLEKELKNIKAHQNGVRACYPEAHHQEKRTLVDITIGEEPGGAAAAAALRRTGENITEGRR